MSLQTWMDEFYPITAEEIAANGTPLEIAQHSLTKWTGTRPENLERHNLNKRHNTVIDNDDSQQKLVLYSDSCSLCRKYFDVKLDTEDEGEPCYNCLIVAATHNTCHSQYGQSGMGNVVPMIELLTKTVEFVKIQSIK